MRKNKGITLIALIITIIIMLILVAVSVNVLIKSNLIGTAENAVDKYKTASEEEAKGGAIEINGKKYASIEDYINKDEIWIDIKYYENNSKYLPSIVCEMGKQIFEDNGDPITFSQKEKRIENYIIDLVNTSLRKKCRKFFRSYVFISKGRRSC